MGKKLEGKVANVILLVVVFINLSWAAEKANQNLAMISFEK